MRDRDRCSRALSAIRIERKARAVTVERLETLPQVAEPHALADLVGDAGSGVGDNNGERIPVALCLQQDAAAGGLRLDAVLHRIPDDRSEEQRRTSMRA